MIAADYNGTWTDHPEIRGDVDFIITATNWDSYDDMMDESDLHIPIFFNPDKQEFSDIIEHKANIINKTGVTKFYEDQPEQVAALKLLCPKTKIVQVYVGRTAI